MPRSFKSHRSPPESSLKAATGQQKRRRKRRKATAPTAAPPAPAPAPASALHRSHFTSYTPSSNSWTTYTPPSITPPQQKLTLLTLNTWSSSPFHSPHQTQALHSLIRGSGADIIALQEVSSPFWGSLTRLDWVRREFVVAGGGTQGWWGVTESRTAGGRGGKGKEGSREAVVLLVRRKWVGMGSGVRVGWMERAKGEGGKGWIEVRLRGVGGREIHLSTSHFSSLPQNASLRQSQYLTVLSSLFSRQPTSPSPPLRILLADLNLTSPTESHALTSPPYSLTDACYPHVNDDDDDEEEEEEEAFRAPPTFGHLYPWVAGSGNREKGKKRKARRVDRVYFSAGEAAPSSSAASSPEHNDEEEAGRGGEGAVQVLHYSHLGDSPLRQVPQSSSQSSAQGQGQGQGKGQRVKDREAVDGWMRASDHAGVRVVLGWD